MRKELTCDIWLVTEVNKNKTHLALQGSVVLPAQNAIVR